MSTRDRLEMSIAARDRFSVNGERDQRRVVRNEVAVDIGNLRKNSVPNDRKMSMGQVTR